MSVSSYTTSIPPPKFWQCIDFFDTTLDEVVSSSKYCIVHSLCLLCTILYLLGYFNVSHLEAFQIYLEERFYHLVLSV